MIIIENCSLLLQNNEKIRYYKDNKKVVIRHKGTVCNGATIYKMIKEINGALDRFQGVRLKFILEFPNVKFSDKLTYIILESVCYSLIVDYGHVVALRGNFVSGDIFSGGIRYSPLMSLGIDRQNRTENFVTEFDKKCISKHHYRRIISSQEKKTSTVFCSIMSEIKTFLCLFCDTPKYRTQVAEVVSELAGNAWEHAKSDCLIDIDVQDGFSKTGQPENEKYYGVNIVVANYSGILLGDTLKKKIKETNSEKLEERCKLVKNAYYNHTKFFNDQYDEEDFFNIASFQDRVSGRISEQESGGTGLPLLIRSLEKQADTHLCYVMSGKHVIWFKLP